MFWFYTQRVDGLDVFPTMHWMQGEDAYRRHNRQDYRWQDYTVQFNFVAFSRNGCWSQYCCSTIIHPPWHREIQKLSWIAAKNWISFLSISLFGRKYASPQTTPIWGKAWLRSWRYWYERRRRWNLCSWGDHGDYTISFSCTYIHICIPSCIGEVRNQDALIIWPSFLHRMMSRWITLLTSGPSCPVLRE